MHSLLHATLLITALATAIKCVEAQKIPEKFILHRAWIWPSDGSHRIKGDLFSTGDSAITLTPLKADYRSGNYSVSTYLIQDIENLNTRKKGAPGLGILIGVAAGFLTGTLIGFAEGDDPSGWIAFKAEQKAVGYGVVLGLLGVSIGAMAWSKTVSRHNSHLFSQFMR